VKVTARYNASLASHIAKALDVPLPTGGSSIDGNRRAILKALTQPMSQPVRAAIIAAWERFDGQGVREAAYNPLLPVGLRLDLREVSRWSGL
jgi:hypothetical protein